MKHFSEGCNNVFPHNPLATFRYLLCFYFWSKAGWKGGICELSEFLGGNEWKRVSPPLNTFCIIINKRTGFYHKEIALLNYVIVRDIKVKR